MSASIVQLLPEVDRLITVTSTPQSLTTLQIEACRATQSSGGRWQMAHFQLKNLQNSATVTASQKLQLAACERHFLASFSGYQNHQSMYQSALTLVSYKDLRASLNLLASSAKCCASAGDFEQAVNMLNQAFEWAWEHVSTEAFLPIFSASVFVCNRMKHHQFAIRCAEQCFTIAEEQQNETELQVAWLKRLNSARLAGLAQIDSPFAQQLRLLDKGQLNYDALNQFLLPVYAALEALDRTQPDCRTASRALAMAYERNNDANDYGLAQYSLALARYHLAFGRSKNAKDAIIEAEYIMPEADLALKSRIRRTLGQLGLGIQLREEKPTTTASQRTWLKFIRLCDSAMTSANTKQYAYN